MDKTPYLNRIAAVEKQIDALEKKSSLLGNLKLLLVVALVASLWFFWQGGFVLWQGLLFLAVMLLNLVFFMWHGKVCQALERQQGLKAIVEKYISRIDGCWADFDDDGADYLDPAHPYTGDLDIFGPASLYQYLSVARTPFGRRAFSRCLEGADYPLPHLAARQQAVAELADMRDFAFDMEFAGSCIKPEAGTEALIDELEQMPDFLASKGLAVLFRWLPPVIWGALALLVLVPVRGLKITALALLCLVFAAALVPLIRSARYLAVVNRAKYGMDEYRQLFQLAEAAPFKSPLLQGMQQRLRDEGGGATTAVKELDGLLQRVEARNNFVLYILLNGLLLWDINTALSLQRWKNRYGGKLGGWFATMGELEALLCFSVLPNVEAQHCLPLLREEGPPVVATGVGHPLLHASRRISNSFTMEGRIYVLSGSNMSGKTTFLRTLALNLLLAKCGACVCAEAFQCRPGARLVTSMRIVDDLSAGMSTFYAELTRIKGILDTAKAHPETLFFIDEIFRGTNSDDRTGGAKAVIDQLGRWGAAGFLTTHDLALCTLAEGGGTENWHFSEGMDAGRLVFDYKIKEGIAQTTNGRYLMQMMGIMEG